MRRIVRRGDDIAVAHQMFHQMHGVVGTAEGAVAVDHEREGAALGQGRGIAVLGGIGGIPDVQIEAARGRALEAHRLLDRAALVEIADLPHADCVARLGGSCERGKCQCQHGQQ